MAAGLPPGGDALYVAAAGSSLAVAGLLAAASRQGHRTGPVLLLFWMLGALCQCSARLGVPLHTGPWPPASRALSALLRAIDAADFPHTGTAALLKALLAGQRDGLDRDTVEAFRAAGASHILALSGLHLGILYGILQGLLAGLGHSRAAVAGRSALSVAAAGFYLMMTGASPSLVRAFLFIVVNELSRFSPGRKRRPAGIFCAALTVQLACSPGVVTSLGFQLSCQLFTAPLVWVRFRTFPRFFLLTNLGALPLTEAFLLLALPCLLPGCPAGIKNLADGAGQALLHFLETIATLS